MDSEQILKVIRLCIVGNEMTWDDFEKIFGSMSKAKQYDIADFIQDDLKIELVDEISPRYFVDVEEIRKAIRPHVIDGVLTYDNFERIFGFLPLKEQYSICYAIQDHLKIELVDETISAPDEEIPDEDVSDEVAPLINRKPNEIKIPNKLLIKLIQDGDKQARQDLCVKNRRLVEKFASKYEKIFDSQLAFEDLVQEGTIGMLKAAEQFDFRKDTQFSTYAVWWIIQFITRAIADTGLTVRLPVHVVEKILKASRHERLFMIQGFDLRRRIELIAQEMQTTPEEVSHLFALRAAYMNIVSKKGNTLSKLLVFHISRIVTEKVVNQITQSTATVVFITAIDVNNVSAVFKNFTGFANNALNMINLLAVFQNIMLGDKDDESLREFIEFCLLL